VVINDLQAEESVPGQAQIQRRGRREGEREGRREGEKVGRILAGDGSDKKRERVLGDE
jgi:hypothetical protein